MFSFAPGRTGAPEGVCHHAAGTLKEITLQENPSSALQDAGSPNFLKLAVPVLMYRIMRHLQQTLLLHDFFQNLHEELICFFQSVLLSLHCFSFTNWMHELCGKVSFHLYKCRDFLALGTVCWHRERPGLLHHLLVPARTLPELPEDVSDRQYSHGK